MLSCCGAKHASAASAKTSATTVPSLDFIPPHLAFCVPLSPNIARKSSLRHPEHVPTVRQVQPVARWVPVGFLDWWIYVGLGKRRAVELVGDPKRARLSGHRPQNID